MQLPNILYNSFYENDMKKTFLLSILSLSLMFVGCSSSGPVLTEENGRPEGSVSDDKDFYRNLADYLSQLSGVNVQGSGNNASVTIRGISSFNLTNEPLYVLDGNALGNSYSQANSLVHPRDIDYVKVLKGSDASMYGVRGANGVIVIVTKK